MNFEQFCVCFWNCSFFKHELEKNSFFQKKNCLEKNSSFQQKEQFFPKRITVLSGRHPYLRQSTSVSRASAETLTSRLFLETTGDHTSITLGNCFLRSQIVCSTFRMFVVCPLGALRDVSKRRESCWIL